MINSWQIFCFYTDINNQVFQKQGELPLVYYELHIYFVLTIYAFRHIDFYPLMAIIYNCNYMNQASSILIINLLHCESHMREINTICPECSKPLTQTYRKYWMRAFAGSRCYRCFSCRSRYLTFIGYFFRV